MWTRLDVCVLGVRGSVYITIMIYPSLILVLGNMFTRIVLTFTGTLNSATIKKRSF